MREQKRVETQYSGAMQQSTLGIIARRAIHFGFEGDEFDEAVQLAIVKLQSFKFDPTRGVSEFTAVVKWIDCAFISFRRGETRINAGQIKFARQQTLLSRGANAGLNADVRDAIKTLSEFDQTVCALIAAGVKKRDLRAHLNCTQAELWNTMLNIRQRFIELGINEWIYEDQIYGC